MRRALAAVAWEDCLAREVFEVDLEEVVLREDFAEPAEDFAAPAEDFFDLDELFGEEVFLLEDADFAADCASSSEIGDAAKTRNEPSKTEMENREQTFNQSSLRGTAPD